MSMVWPGVEPRHLTALLAIQQEGSFRGAARRLGLAQSAVSQRIAQLERLVGSDLVTRWPGQATMSLTDAGRLLAKHAEGILAEFGVALADLRAATNGTDATLRLGTYETVGSRLVPPALKRLADEHSALRVVLHEDPEWRRFFPLVGNGELDAAFAELPIRPGPFTVLELAPDPYMLVVSADSPLARRAEPPTLAEIGALPLIAPSWPLLRVISAHLRAAGVEARFTFRSQTDAGVQALVAHGVGVALMPRMAAQEADRRVAFIALDDVLPARRVVLYWHRDRRETEAITWLVGALTAADAD